MELGDEDFEFFSSFMDEERKKLREVQGRQLRREARESYSTLTGIIDAITPVPGGVATAVDRPFVSTGTLPPSTLIEVQLRLAIYYVQSADEGDPPTLSAFVVLRVAIECVATAHWLMSGGSIRDEIERALKRMWWDTVNAADMASTADGDHDSSALDDLRARITAVIAPVKRIDLETITTSQRVSLSGLVEEAGRAMRREDPTALFAAWKVCAAVSHGNIPVSAGAGIAAELIQRPSQHPIDEPVYAEILSMTVAHLRIAVELFRDRAARQHSHSPSRPES